jgi:sucrose 6(F)-phosphate phosphorylase
MKLMRFRNEYPAFDGTFQVLPGSTREVRLRWQKGEQQCTLVVDLNTYRSVIQFSDGDGEMKEYQV